MLDADRESASKITRMRAAIEDRTSVLPRSGQHHLSSCD